MKNILGMPFFENILALEPLIYFIWLIESRKVLLEFFRNLKFQF